MNEITAEELKEKIDSGDSFILLDVRESFETYISSIAVQTICIPLDELGDRTDELGIDNDIIVMCRCGNRSKSACELLYRQGFSRVANLKGGINTWAEKIDPSLPRY